VYEPKKVYSGENILGPWNEIWAPGADDMCLKPGDIKPITQGEVEIKLAVQQGTLVSGEGACSASNVQGWASEAGISMPAEEAAVLACMAGPESRCGADAKQNYCWDSPVTKQCTKGTSSAYGPYQVLLKGNSEYFENAACYRAAGVSGPLNCDAAFNSKGYSIPGPTLERCKRAAANYPCNVAAAHEVYKVQGAKAWTADPNSSKQRGCAVKAR
jgi:hypothetical protein